MWRASFFTKSGSSTPSTWTFVAECSGEGGGAAAAGAAAGEESGIAGAAANPPPPAVTGGGPGAAASSPISAADPSRTMPASGTAASPAIGPAGAMPGPSQAIHSSGCCAPWAATSTSGRPPVIIWRTFPPTGNLAASDATGE